MKIFITIMIIFMAGICYAADGDIDNVEIVPDVAFWKLDTVKFQVFTKTCTVTYRKVDAGENYLNEFNVYFRDVDDNPETIEDETLTEFTDLVAAINNGSNIKNTIMQAVQIKLGI